MRTSEIVAAISAIIALAALIVNMLRNKATDDQAAQSIRDKLEYIGSNTRDIRDDVRALDRKLDDHAARITKMEARMDDHGRRIERLENAQ